MVTGFSFYLRYPLWYPLFIFAPKLPQKPSLYRPLPSPYHRPFRGHRCRWYPCLCCVRSPNPSGRQASPYLR